MAGIKSGILLYIWSHYLLLQLFSIQLRKLAWECEGASYKTGNCVSLFFMVRMKEMLTAMQCKRVGLWEAGLSYDAFEHERQLCAFALTTNVVTRLSN